MRDKRVMKSDRGAIGRGGGKKSKSGGRRGYSARKFALAKSNISTQFSIYPALEL